MPRSVRRPATVGRRSVGGPIRVNRLRRRLGAWRIDNHPASHALATRFRANPKADWTPDNVEAVARAHGLTLRQRGTSPAAVTTALGRHPTIPMHKPIKPLYVRRLVELIEAAQ